MRSQEIISKLKQQLIIGEFGIEKESLRVDEKGWLAQTDHPAIDDDRISRDFSESQVEFISGVHLDLQETCAEICMLQEKVEKALAHRKTGREYLWTYSNPPLYHGESDIRIAEFSGIREEKTTYRSYLSEKYGRVKMLYSGVHLNYSLPASFFETLQKLHSQQTIQDIKNQWYLRLADFLMSDSWLLVALTAASPIASSEFLEGLSVPKTEWNAYASFRSSQYGYWNHFVPQLSYRDFASYLDSIADYVKEGAISSIQELYYPIRLKPQGENSLENLRKNGVNHIELRMLDLNPLCCAGVEIRDLMFIHLLILYRLRDLPAAAADGQDSSLEQATDHQGVFQGTLPGTSLDPDRILLHKKAARLNFWEEEKTYQAYALELIADMNRYFSACQKEGSPVPEEYLCREALSFQQQKILDPKKRYAWQLRNQYKDSYIPARMQEIKTKSQK